MNSNRDRFVRWRGEVRWKVATGRMWSFLVVMPTPDAANMVEMLFRYDHELVQALKLQCLDESLDAGSQIG